MASSPEEIEKVFEAWRRRQARPDSCKLTTERRDLIRRRMGTDYSAEDLIAVIDYIYEAEEDDPRWMRGEAPGAGRAWLDLENILRRQRISERVEAALRWRGAQEERAEEGEDEDEDLGPMAHVLRAQRRGTPLSSREEDEPTRVPPPVRSFRRIQR